MTELISADAERYALSRTAPLTGTLAEAASWTAANTASPQMMSGLAEIRLLQALIVMSGARQVLEVGTFTGVGTIAMASMLPESGRVITLERDDHHVEIASRHIQASGLGDRIELIHGDALETMGTVSGPFDLVYIDARKADYPDYYRLARPKLAPRGVIVADNLFRAGEVLDKSVSNADNDGMRNFAREVHDDASVGNALLTVGDGLMLVWNDPRRVSAERD